MTCNCQDPLPEKVWGAYAVAGVQCGRCGLTLEREVQPSRCPHCGITPLNYFRLTAYSPETPHRPAADLPSAYYCSNCRKELIPDPQSLIKDNAN